MTEYKGYKISENGYVLSLGKFENERKELIDAYEIYLDGFADEDDGTTVTVTLESGETIKFIESSEGFIFEV